MSGNGKVGALILGAFVFLGLAALGSLLGNSAIKFKEYERSVTVKGLSEREYPADIVIWPIQFTVAGNDLEGVYGDIEDATAKIKAFLEQRGIEPAEISASAPGITDKSAQSYGGSAPAEFRYSASRTVTVYSGDIDKVRSVKGVLGELGKQGIAISGSDYQAQTEYLFTKLNEIKPAMIEEATKNARQGAKKFAEDSQSTLGKIKRASQGQFSINNRDNNTHHIKKIRVVVTVEYYLSD